LLDQTAPQHALRHRAPLAPAWHTAALVGLLLAVAITGTLLQPTVTPNSAPNAPSATLAKISARYLPLLVVNWLLLLYTTRIGRKRSALGDLLSEGARNFRRWTWDLLLGVACFAAIMGAEALFTTQLAAGRNAAISSLLPSTGAERLTWLVVALSVGFCEEVVYRGYLQTQLAAFTRSRALGLILQAALFGVAHLEQGPQMSLRIALYGLLFGLLAHFRRTLWPSIVAHTLLDLAAAFLR
jgi:membrane protease YdiL (CAAX protease family)